ncbi:MAG: ferrochelatase [Planctomycetota bacterium]
MHPGILLVNLGTPRAPERADVARYLREFLTDRHVLDVATPLRLFLGGFLIPLVRSARSAEAYRSIWTERGSPLLFHSKDLAAALRARVAPIEVALGMRYGEPSIASALERLRDCDPIVVVPLYPQNAASSTGTAVEATERAARRLGVRERLRFVPPFHDRPEFLDAFAEVARPHVEDAGPELVLFSYHGLPERHVRRADPSGAHCLASPTCCDVVVDANRGCYRRQCLATTRELAKRLGLAPDRVATAFQSRLGRDPWLGPPTDEVVRAAAASGVRRLAVLCPSFVADCLETLEEIGGEAAKTFVEHGGESFTLVPCPNAEPAWVSGLEAIVRDELGSRVDS